ncbi:hypothetical protein Vadar_001025 [Vaccinium darrowii]|uniref:Uncharacterized protein n=1 Tax=Vaccinium darrowii TaxID=229202 RepID=A0ACB7WWT4_9ERIC|nr:hypothetical protein Vadar_001025 [Vaccinium darrowii]
MGCTASKLDNEDTVRRCKDHRRYMKDAIYARHHLAAAHSDYCLEVVKAGEDLTGEIGRNRTLDDVWVVDVAEDLDFTADLTADGVFVVAVNDGGGGGDDGDQFRRQ